MKFHKISVIVPVYNVEKYLRQCIDSILVQTFTDFELLLIDDGSTDKSGDICDEYAVKDARVRVFHTENRGVSAARNNGLREASGDWICFVDSDDWVEDDYLQCLLYERKLIDECLVCQSFYVEDELCPEKRYKSRLYSDVILKEPFDVQQMMMYILNDYSVNIFAKLFNRNVINENNVYFCEKTSVFEDAIFLHEYLLLIKEIHLRSSVSYHYVQKINNNQSLTRKKHSCEEWMITADELLKTNDLLIKKFSISGVKDLRNIYNRYGLRQLYSAYVNVRQDNYIVIFNRVKECKYLFYKYYVPLTFSQRLFMRFFFHNWMPKTLVYAMSQIYKMFIKRC